LNDKNDRKLEQNSPSGEFGKDGNFEVDEI